MIDHIASLVLCIAFLLAVSLIARWDANRWRCRLTPFGVAAIPFAILSVLAVPAARPLGFVEMNPAILLVWAAGLASFLAASVLARKFSAIPSDASFTYLDSAHLDAAVPLARVITTVAAAVASVKLYSLLGDFGALARLADEEFQAEFGGGFAGHVQALAYPAVAVLVARGRHVRKLDFIFIALGMLGALLYQVKYTVFIPVAAGVILAIQLGTITPSLRNLSMWSFAGVAGFMLVYMLGFAAMDPSSVADPEIYISLLRHLVGYLLSGILAFSEILRGGAQQFLGSDGIVLLPFRNLSAAMFGGQIVGNEEAIKTTVLISDEGTRENVFTLFGSLYLNLGFAGMLAYSFMLALIAYFFLGFARRCASAWFACAPALTLAFFAFGWFHSFFYLLTPLEVAVAALLLAGVSGIRVARPAPAPTIAA